jgi:anti-sigma factor RsiW
MRESSSIVREREPLLEISATRDAQRADRAPRRASIDDDPKLKADYTERGKSRAEFNELLHGADPATVARKWQRGYFQGKAIDGDPPFHVNKRCLKPVE